MDRKTYEKTKAGEFIGRKVISLRPMRNGMFIFPAGMTWTIEGKQGGFALLSDPAPTVELRLTSTRCNRSMWILQTTNVYGPRPSRSLSV